MCSISTTPGAVRLRQTRRARRAIGALHHEGYASTEILEAAFSNFCRAHPEKMSLRSKLLARYLCHRYMEPDQEILGALYFDASNTILTDRELFRGVLTRIFVTPRPIIAHALNCGAQSVALFHTHPGGLSSPSGADRAFTDRVRMASAEMGLEFLGLLIMGNGSRCAEKPTDVPCWLQWIT